MFTYLLAQGKKSSLTVWWRDNVHLPSGQEIFFHLLFGEKIMFIYLLAKKIKLHLLFGEEIMFIYFLAKKKSSLTVWWRESPQKGEPAHATFLQTQMLKKKDNGKTKTLRLYSYIHSKWINRMTSLYIFSSWWFLHTGESSYTPHLVSQKLPQMMPVKEWVWLLMTFITIIINT